MILSSKGNYFSEFSELQAENQPFFVVLKIVGYCSNINLGRDLGISLPNPQLLREALRGVSTTTTSMFFKCEPPIFWL